MAPVRPRALRPGDLLGVCAPSGPPDPERLRRGVAAVEALGFPVRLPEGLLVRTRFTAGSVERRVDELHALFADDAVKGVLCARGGAGAGQLLPALDGALLRSHPKVFVGFSDATFLHLYFDRLGLVSFHGPMVAWDFPEGTYDASSFRWAVMGEGAAYASEEGDLMTLRAGSAEGRLRGGCLSILAAAAGTPWQLTRDDEGTLLFLEDVDEPPYRIDRMLRQLRDSGGLEGVRGIVFGDMKGCVPRLDADYSLEDVIGDALAGLEIPIAVGLSSGHTSSPNLTLPLGVRARLRCGEEASFEVLEPSVS
ncbi:MAG TPA: LD-carboxypeptidase [Vicinamibacteria bacterium]|nr:LD-carboxypeptidase [Vicinamibacteria bacterium]